MFTVFEEARPVVLTEKLHDGRGIGRVICWPALESFERRLDAGLPEEGRGVFAVFVEVSVEYALIHHVTLAVDLEDDPSQVMGLEDSECVGTICDGLLDDLSV